MEIQKYWKIGNEEKAKELSIKVLEGVVTINMALIPKGITLDEFLETIQKEGIIVLDDEKMGF